MRTTSRLVSISFLVSAPFVAFALAATPAFAQGTTTPASPTAPATAASPSAASAATAAPAPEAAAPTEPVAAPAPAAEPVPEPAASTCTPSCRHGFVCVAGQCVSACNPPCGEGERCSEQLECVDKQPSTLSFFANVPTKLPPPEAGVHEHDGLMARVTLGGGVAGASQSAADEGGSTLDFAGFAGSFSLDVGTTPYENLVLHLRVADMALRDPSIEVDGDEVAETGREWIGAGLVAAGVTYYFMPANVYATGAVGVSWMRVRGSSDRRAYTTDTGIGLNIDIGKEWWIDTQWAIGVATRFWLSRLTDHDNGDRLEYQFAGGALLFSATYQ